MSMIREPQRFARSGIKPLHFIALFCVVVSLILSRASVAQKAGATLSELPFGVLKPPSLTKSSDDLDGILAKRTLRVLVVPNRTNYFLDRATERGLTFDSFTLFGAFLERSRQRQMKSASPALGRLAGRVRLHVVFVPVSRDQVLQALNDGRGDVAAASLTITDARSRTVDFTNPVVPDVNEIIVSGPDAPSLQTLEDLAGRAVHVRRHTSYFQSMTALNTRLQALGRPPVRLILLPDALENEDKLEMVNAGLIEFAVIEEPLVNFWIRVFPNIKGHPRLIVRRSGNIAWAVRKNSPQLREALNQFLKSEYSRGAMERESILARYLGSTQWIRPVYRSSELQRYHRVEEMFRRYSTRYGFEFELVLAVAMQESRLQQSVVSPMGAIGLMQVMPATAREMDVGNIRVADSNVHAGVRYLRQLMDQYFNDPQLTTLNRMLFAFASYNAGPNRISRLRDEAGRLGFDRNQWFGNVEYVVADRVGLEPVHYVGNILKYYVAYTRIQEVEKERARARKTF
jgi:membrane-bound lytic murein transglycosylase MltF